MYLLAFTENVLNNYGSKLTESDPRIRLVYVAIKSLATHATLYNIYISYLIGPDQQMRLVFHTNCHSNSNRWMMACSLWLDWTNCIVVPTVIVHCGSPAASTS